MAKNNRDYDNIFKTLKHCHKRLFISVINQTFNFPNGETIHYDYENVLLTNYTKEQLIECRLFPYIPYYIIRYENEISRNGNIEPALADLEYFRNELSKLYQNNELSAEELLDIMSYTNRIVKHLTDGNQYEERMVRVMGGKVEETPSQELKRLENEKIALNLFKNGVAYDTVRKSISNDIIDDSTLKGLMNLALQTI